MAGCCEATANNHTDTCLTCGTKGQAVHGLTVKALLTESALRRFEPGAYRFCPDAGCSIVYFDAGRVYTKSDVRVPVSHKEPAGARMVCYCFDENEVDIRAEIARTGASKAVERVREHIAAGRCACEVRNPRGVCCLGDVMHAVTWMTETTIVRK